MIEKINTKLNIIKQANNWIGQTEEMRGTKGKNAYRNFVNFRRQLKKKNYALEDNPAAALYGESQVGKSYLASSLLANNGQPFNIIDGQNNTYDFINTINPIGKGTESTSLITRFSTNYSWVNPDFPVKAKLLSVADLILVLCDSYYNDVKAKVDTTLKAEDLKMKVNDFRAKYEGSNFKQGLLTEDEILDIQEYFELNFSTKASTIKHSGFFDEISLFIDKVKIEDWTEIFSLLWNNNQYLTKLFEELLEHHKKLDFATEVYLPIDVVIRDKGTLLEVSRLYEIYGSEKGNEADFEPTVSIMIGEKEEKIVENFSKSYLCALAAELVFKLPQSLQDEKSFLKETDLLDFPGARHRLKIQEDDIEDAVIPKMLLRGKVAYLFNNYSRLQKINILLFCQHNEDTKQGAMPELLNDWIQKMIGETPEERQKFISKCKIPPLFIISTKFNLDLAFDPRNDKKGNQDSLNGRWKRRFVKALEKGVLSTETYDWFEKWTAEQPNFQNIYLLRDFFYSSEGESNVYKGYQENKTEKEEIIPKEYPDFREDLKQSFVENNFVKKHFKDPEEVWNTAASINQDGSKLIIDKLTLAASHINVAREAKISHEIKEIKQGILTELKKYYHDSNSDKRLKKAKEKAGKIQANLDIIFGQNPYFFGPMIQKFMLNESDVYSLYQQRLRTAETLQSINMEKYNGIRTNVPELDPNADFDTNLEKLCKHYEHSSIKACREYFESQKIDLEELFYGNNERVIQFSKVLAESLEKYWFEQYLKDNTKNLTSVFSETGWQEIQEMLRTLYDKLKITDRIANRIRTYVDGNTKIDEVYEMVADLSAEIINKFINTVGIEYYSESDLADLQSANEKNGLGLVLDHSELDFEENSPEEVADLITNMDKLDELLNQNPLPADAKRLSNYRSYIRWYHRLKIGFVSVCDIPNYDVQANQHLEKIIKETEAA